MTWSNVATDRPPSALSSTNGRDQRGGPSADRAVFAGVLAVLLATGWAANHFAALLPAIRDHQHLGASTLNAVSRSTRWACCPGCSLAGARRMHWGASRWHGQARRLRCWARWRCCSPDHSAVLLVGRVIVGAGVGFAISSCTAWASDLKGPAGAAVAGAVLTAGFAIGPFASGLIASAGQSGIRVSFAIAAAIVALATTVAGWPRGERPGRQQRPAGGRQKDQCRRVKAARGR